MQVKPESSPRKIYRTARIYCFVKICLKPKNDRFQGIGITQLLYLCGVITAMKKIHIVFLILIVAALAGMSFFIKDLTTYETFVSAQQKPDKFVVVKVQLDKSKPVEYDQLKDPNLTTFYAVDRDGNKTRVVYKNAKPTDIERSEGIDLNGYMRDGYFECTKLQMKKLVQVGTRDYSQSEWEFIQDNKNRLSVYFDKDIRTRQFEGERYKEIVEEIVSQLPDKVYISFDVDGLDPKLCPNTGTPVPGGFETEQVFYLLDTIHKAGKKIIGFDLCEVSTSETGWDANVGARILFKLCNLLVASNPKQ